MHISVVRLYHPAPWGWLYSYQALLLFLRILELSFISGKYFLFRAPVLVAWTRLPELRNRRAPWSGLASVLAPIDTRASLNLGGCELGTDLADAETVDDVDGLMSGFLGTVNPPSRFWSVAGCVIRGFFTDLGPAFIKFGQILSMREEIPPTIKKELALLQDRLPPMSPREVRERLERELEKPVEVVFEWFDETPVAAGSLAQVHRGKLRLEQKEVAVKLRRPYLEGIVQLDTIIICDIFFGALNRCLPLLHKSSDTRLFTSSYRESLEQEIDLVLEARHQQEYRRRVMSHPIYGQTNYIADIYPQYTTTKLIIMELVTNFHRMDRLMDELTPEQLLDFATTEVEGYSPDLPLQLAFAQVALCIEGMCHWGFSHGDFHLGNMYALEPRSPGDHWRIFLCDFGMMMQFIESDRLTTIQCILDLAYYCEGDILVRTFFADTDMPLTKKQEAKSIRHLQTVFKKYMTEEGEGAERAMRFTIQPNSPTNVVGEIVYGAATLGLKMQNTMYWLLLKNMSYAAGTALTLSTNFNATPMMSGHPSKFIKDWVMRELDTLDVADMRTYCVEKLAPVRHYDRSQIMQALANGEPITPKAKQWVATGKDARFLEQKALPSPSDGDPDPEGDRQRLQGASEYV